jgi:tRNA (mo5U34)-methyltransferase
MRNATETTKAGLAEEVAKIPFWYHRIELPGGVTTPGWAPLDASKYAIPDDLTGKTVLDIGSWDGYWTWEAAKRGAAYVVAIDDFSDELGNGYASRADKWKTWDLCRGAFELDNCCRYTTSVYSAANLGMQFDVIFCFGLLYHLKHPTWALEQLRAAARHGCTIHIESAILDDLKTPYTGYRPPRSACHAEYYPGSEFAMNESNWCCPTLNCIEAWLKMTGWSDIKTWKLEEDPKQMARCRGFASARVTW